MGARAAGVSVALRALGSPDALFVRPDSPLKPFAGRVLPAGAISLRALDFLFYFDDPDLPWRYARAVAVALEVSAAALAAG